MSRPSAPSPGPGGPRWRRAVAPIGSRRFLTGAMLALLVTTAAVWRTRAAPSPPLSAPSPSGKAHPANRLAGESSPYLLQHSHNPVDWYPWGAEAFEKAQKEGKPIFLSIGYSSCHWCHVMERE